MRFELRRLTDYSEQAILDEVRRVAALVNAPKLSRAEFRRHSRVSPTTVYRRFGDWEHALRAAGLADRFDSSNKPVSREEILAELQRVSRLLGIDALSREQFNLNARFTDAVVRKAFQTWHKAMSVAGLSTNALGKRYTDEDCFENLLTVWTHYGRTPTHDEMKRPPSTVGPKAYIQRFGTWTRALQAFSDRVNADNTEAQRTQVAPIQSALPKIPRSTPEAERREIRVGLRYWVLKRDRFRCVLCGRSPATHHNVDLHLDHLVPVSKGGRTIRENLRTLCKECNLGKGSQDEEAS